MASQQAHRSVLLQRCNHFRSTTTTTLPYYLRNFNPLQLSRKLLIAEKIRVFNLTYGGGRNRFYCLCKTNSGPENVPVQIKENNDDGRPPFDINLAVVLAGFAFEAYTTPPEKIGTREVDAANCTTVFLSESFLREIYDGQLIIKLKKGLKLPAMDPWGTSDPYVVFQLDSQVLKSKVKWGTREPTWNEDFTLNIKLFPTKNLQIAAWDANLITPHKRMGNGSLSLESLCDGNPHEVLVELEGMGGGGEIQLEIRYKSFDEIDEDKKWWAIPMVTDFLRRSGFESAMKMIVGTETVQAREFVQYAFGQMKLLNDAYGQTDWLSKLGMSSGGYINTSSSTAVESDLPAKEEHDLELCGNETIKDEKFSLEVSKDNSDTGNGQASLYAGQHGDEVQSDKYFWKNFGSLINENVVQKLGLPPPEKIKWDGFDLLNRIGFQSRRIAEASYIESGLATPVSEDNINNDGTTGSTSLNDMKSSLPDIEKLTRDLLRQTDSILGALMVLNATVSKINKEGLLFGKSKSKEDESTGNEDRVSQYARDKNLRGPLDRSELDENKAEEMRALFSTAETAMEAWAMLATSLGQPSFIKSEFEKICFLDNQSTDTQVAIWRDSPRKRLVVAFRGTEQTKWKDLVTDLMLLPAGLNPERIGGDFNQEVQVHSGFLSAYDSVRNRILSLINVAMGYRDSGDAPSQPWHVYVTGHSLGGALATLLALDLSSSRLAKCGSVFVTMYNFGSPRVGNKRFAEVYNEMKGEKELIEKILNTEINIFRSIRDGSALMQHMEDFYYITLLEKVKDSWRIVNHRDIIPTVPRLMGYCHVAQPIYLATGGQKMATENMELSGDGYQGDVIGEATPDVLVSEFMKGEKELIEKILNTEINIFRSIRDGSALMQHMEDFYYITLLENVRLNYQDVGMSQTTGKNRL